jgi:DNA-binding beta-propeller fold protein YncE
MRLYIRKDVVGQLWNYGAAPSAEAVVADPFEEKHLSLSAERVLGSQGAEPGQYQGPRDLEVAEDGSLYVADTGNHRIQHISPEGEVLHVWGAFGDLAAGAAPEGTFNQPWGVGIGRDGSVYVADTWNHRVQKFSADGKFLKMWGYFGQAENPDAFWGPRDIAVSDQGLVFITDTGNKRVVVFDEEGNFITQFGTAGMLPGEFDEPVGVTLDKDGRVFVADTWNQRVQVFERQEDGVFLPVRSWDVPGWYGQSLDNKPYLAVDELGRAFLADPEGYRVMVFSSAGQALLAWGDYGTGADAFGLAASAAIAPDGGIWVTDAGNHRIMYFLLPAQ